MRFRYVASVLLVILGIGGLYWATRRPAEPPRGQIGSSVELHRGLVGYWKLQGDCRDHSGHEHHGTNHGVDLQTGSFDGRSAHIEVPARDSLQLGRGDFTISAWIHTDKIVDDAWGDVLNWYDPDLRKGVTE